VILLGFIPSFELMDECHALLVKPLHGSLTSIRYFHG